MSKLTINREVFRDKVMGCWLGKNAGGTLGEPLEEKFGRDEMFDIDWYPELPEGGIPNDDLELQLIWLQTILQKGPGITSEDLVEAWTDCIAYNFDEYGLSKENMQKGLLPPVCGWHNNAFKDCMGSPIRSEIWACLAPGAPEIAARYAWMDACVDHGGGESVYGEIFNTVLESAAFFQSDKFDLLSLALASIPEESLTHQCVSRVIENYHNGVSYTDNRNDVKVRFYNPVAQYSPLNLGFQTIGWLYGTDFGDSICKAVNCGWDTDCTAATLGALLGIIGGAKSLPEKWLKPLGNVISTNMTTGGIRHLSAPTDIVELTEVVCSYAETVLRYWGTDIRFSDEAKMDDDIAFAVPKMAWMDDYLPNAVSFELGGLKERVIYHQDAALLGGRASRISLELENPHSACRKIQIKPFAPKGICVTPLQAELTIEPGRWTAVDFTVQASEDSIKEQNPIYFELSQEAHPQMPPLPCMLLGGRKWLFGGLFPNQNLEDACGVAEDTIFKNQPVGFSPQWRAGNDLELPLDGGTAGVIYALAQIRCPAEKAVVIGVPNNSRMKIFLNGQLLHQTLETVPLRANLGNGGALGDLANYKTAKLIGGWNQILIKIEVKEGTEAHFTIGGMSEVCVKNHGEPVLGLERSRFMWE